MNTPALTMNVRVWGWLFAACLFVLVGCSILAIDAHNTINEYKSLRQQGSQAIRQEIVNASLSQNAQCRTLIISSYDQLKQYVDVQIPMRVRDAMGYVPPININQTANPAVNISPNTTK